MKLNFEILGEYISFYIDDKTQLNDWNKYPEITYPLFRFYDCEKDKLKTKLTIPLSQLLKLENYELKRLGFPSSNPFLLYFEADTTIVEREFVPKVYFRDKFNRDVYYEELSFSNNELYPFVSINGNKYTIKEPEYSILNTLYKLKNMDQSNSRLDRLDLFKELQDLTPFETKSINTKLFQIKITSCQKISLDLLPTEDFVIVPELIVDSNKDSTQLNEHDSNLFKKQFIKTSKTPSKFDISRDEILIFSKPIRIILDEIKRINQEPKPKRKAFFYNPEKFVRDKLANLYQNTQEVDDIINDLFIATDSYVSQRISHIGVFQAISGSFITRDKNNWIPEEIIGVEIQNSIFSVKPADLENLVGLINAAVVSSQPTVSYDGQEIPAIPEAVEALGVIIEKEKEKNKVQSGISSEPKDMDEKLVPVIINNIDGDTYNINPREKLNYSPYISSFMLSAPKNKEQVEGINWLCENYIEGRSGVILADDMGLGKTYQTLAFLQWYVEVTPSEHRKPILIVGPTALLKNWEEEQKKFIKNGLGNGLNTNSNDFKRYKGQPINYVVRDLKNYDFILATYDSIRINEIIFRQIEFSIIVFDEVQKLKNPNALNTHMAKALSFEFAVAISGTPVENHLGDLWSISDLVSPMRLGTLKTYIQEFHTEGKVDELEAILFHQAPPPFVLRRLKKDVLQGLPEKKIIPIKIQMSKLQEMAYDQAIERCKNSKEQKVGPQTLFELKVLSLHGTELDVSDEEFVQENAKIKASIEILDGIKSRNEKVIVFLERRELQLRFLELVHRKYAISLTGSIINGEVPGQMRQDLVKNFYIRQKGFDILIISPRAGGVGLNIVCANNVIHLERWWNPAVENQATDRVYRIGQEKDVNVYIPMAFHPQLQNDSFDIILDELLRRKNQLAENLLNITDFSEQDAQNFFTRATGTEAKDHYFKKYDDLLNDPHWQELRKSIFNIYPNMCFKCESTDNLQVDHVKPRSKYPDLTYEFSNLQILCDVCNRAKSDIDDPSWDYRHRVEILRSIVKR